MPKGEKLKVAQVYFYVKNMDRAIDFYTKTLGLPLKVRFDNHWAEVDAGSITIGLHPTEDGKKPKTGGGGTVSFQVTDIDALIDRLKKKGARVGNVHSPERGRFVMVTDPDGHPIHMVEFARAWLKESRYKPST